MASVPPASQSAGEALVSSIESGAIAIHTDVRNLDFDKMTSIPNNGTRVIEIPISYIGSRYSNIRAVVNNRNRVIDYAEAHFTERSPDHGHAAVWSNGKPVLDRDLFASGDRIVRRGVGDALTELNACLSSAGIPAWLIAGVMAACRTVIGPGLAACLIAGGVGAATAAFCQGRAISKL
ncbi:hypothetical protein [Nocardia brasiliensis]|uniref:hypothetical protein n=1 Tax=Nocardia brasiliensis TaxID=37326 RepID=UPI002457CDD5|nr:hypothetical protein [Nocardia brasiliensis]